MPRTPLNGATSANTPRFVYTLASDLVQPIGSSEAYLRVDYTHRSSYDTSGSKSRYTLIEPYGLLNARIGARIDDGRFDFAIWARNLTNRRYFTSLAAANNGLITGNIGDPRTIGATARLNF
jgi:iron complex outermembrane recepter protein